ncbi:MAG: thioredoxin [Chloroflexi bacterium]|nr:MAG: thioredoxin [Chloroflexota bacterium]
MTTPLAVNDQEFEQTVLEADGLVLVDFWATWCGGCRLLAPVIDQLADEYADKLKVVKVNVDEYAEHAIQYEVRHTPTVVFFRNGQEVERIVGAGKKALYTSKINELLH